MALFVDKEILMSIVGNDDDDDDDDVFCCCFCFSRAFHSSHYQIRFLFVVQSKK